MIAFILACFSALAHGSITDPNLEKSEFPYNAVLDQKGSFQLFWTYDKDNIKFQLHAETKGWAAIGFSPTGGMAGADIALIWVDKGGKPFISDRHAGGIGFPPEDAQQDYTLISGTRNDTHIIATFTRKRNTCDKDDWVLSDDTIKVIYAFNDEIPESKDRFSKHTTRGSKSLHFFDQQMDTSAKKLEAAHAKPIELRVQQVKVPEDKRTTYWCEVIELPRMPKKMHIIQSEPLIQPENVDIVHHIVIYACGGHNMSEYIGKGRSCLDDNNIEYKELDKCRQKVIAVWAVGGQNVAYPEDVGMPLPNYDGTEMYALIEMHYDNANLLKGRMDSSGMKVWVTDELRPIEGGQLLFGVVPGRDSVGQVIPPGVKEFTNYAYCTAGCTEHFPEDGVKVMGGLLHTHLAGRKIRLLHFRHGKQLPDIMTDNHYDFNFQDYRRRKEPAIILPGDEILVECVYETLDRNTTTFSGMGTHDEMCIIFADYYPAIKHGFMCMSLPNHKKMFQQFGIQLMENSTSKLLVKLPDGGNVTLWDYVKNFDFQWTPEKVARLQNAMRNEKHMVICGKNSSKKGNDSMDMEELGIVMASYPNITEPLIELDICAGATTNAGPKIAETQGPAGTNRPAAQPLVERNGVAGRSHGVLYLMILQILLVIRFR